MTNASTRRTSLNKASGDLRVQDQAQVPTVADAARAARIPKLSNRTGKIRIVTYLHPDFRDSIRLVQNQTGENLRETVTRALNTLFIEYNVPVVEDGISEHD